MASSKIQLRNTGNLSAFRWLQQGLMAGRVTHSEDVTSSTKNHESGHLQRSSDFPVWDVNNAENKNHGMLWWYGQQDAHANSEDEQLHDHRMK